MCSSDLMILHVDGMAFNPLQIERIASGIDTISTRDGGCQAGIVHTIGGRIFITSISYDDLQRRWTKALSSWTPINSTI